MMIVNKVVNNCNSFNIYILKDLLILLYNFKTSKT